MDSLLEEKLLIVKFNTSEYRWNIYISIQQVELDQLECT